MKDLLMIFMVVLALQRKSLVLAIVKKRQNFAWVCIIMVIAVINSVTGKKFISLKLIIKM